MFWQTSRRRIQLERTLVMAILNTTPDSFSDGGKFFSVDDALRRADEAVSEGADILDIGGESTRPGGERVSDEAETARVIPVIETIAKRIDIPISVDTSKSLVAERALNAGAEIVNDISGLRFDPKIASIAAETGAGLILMHSAGDADSLHSLRPEVDIIETVGNELRSAVSEARRLSVGEEQLVLDVGIGFGKTLRQNLELLAKLDKIIAEFPEFPMLVGTSRKSFIGKVATGADDALDRMPGSISTAIIAVWNGASIIRAHDVEETVQAMRLCDAIMEASG